MLTDKQRRIVLEGFSEIADEMMFYVCPGVDKQNKILRVVYRVQGETLGKLLEEDRKSLKVKW